MKLRDLKGGRAPEREEFGETNSKSETPSRGILQRRKPEESLRLEDLRRRTEKSCEEMRESQCLDTLWNRTRDAVALAVGIQTRISHRKSSWSAIAVADEGVVMSSSTATSVASSTVNGVAGAIAIE
ncbi:hypothetical protein Vadar_011652 [Vaccinium darrowii]|uniref:Uncharacterized protein n=1 Tax=Vaccinium darrowii TaxID=229202 RepID=A0ACB7X9R2_9ERIC|nr:hypothetical protein Vadar_011652 [Vaccinium darrowii]